MNRLITASELKQHINKGAIIFDCRFRLNDPDWGRQAYRQGHIPGAFYLHLNEDLSSPVQAHGGRHPLPQWQTLVHTLNRAGVTPQSSILLYDDARFAYAARAWWLLKQIGLHDVALLDGGFEAWVAMGGALDRREPNPRAGNLKIASITAAIRERTDIIANGDQYLLIDSREPKRYRGEEEPIDPVAGHIPGALNFPWQEVTDDKGFCKPVEQQQARWQTANTSKEIVVYCGSGVTACVNLFSLELAGIPATLYPGSWSDWCSYTDAPIATAE
ncbi:sulfurtransferase [Cellvibrio japonicus]|uniref:Thiosulfate sulfurtransferase n=1 Tax=Cellvibrio japonicus (strain Ueda107) TaxID=498211 RepID=B3PGT6_CELJU|nr:sulfurtransferase [Cellvibrio japonicus]ACE85981.1 thiosulfate sulfurtransferase [Cellvibrio japonicus Ueda107]QEI12430.1 sulfurtransferase [Cellvibrio japonicus]QEI16003.1 sulfurtransferase [Cellvibrio japonicus]QEI19582.1 sulfurtransferase [Cellvibrio japonicus]